MLQIDDSILKRANISAGELKQEIACLLYSQQRISIGLAKDFAEMDLINFQRLLSSKKIPINYSLDDFESDLTVVNES